MVSTASTKSTNMKNTVSDSKEFINLMQEIDAPRATFED